ncbi:putative nuclease HARBI1 [Ostrea edulis]|uniref:putative nuclease HARBI1 n=1 Tax=Ostrea edulis TaxID=37623 RepID=UPI0024AF3F09|nr:putative nuclease HARBI1 [Ostrea edulis]
MADKVGIVLAVDYLLDEEDIDEDDEDILPHYFVNVIRRERVPSIKSFYEEVLPDFSFLDFSKHFRLTKQTFTRLFREIEPNIAKDVRTQGRQPILTEKRAMVGLWYLCNTTSMREISLLFGISQSTVFDCVHDFCDALCSVRNRIISWPGPQRQQEISDHFEAECQIPGIVGIIDGSHITLTSVPNGDQDYINRKGYPSLQLQLIVDHILLITDSFVGWPGCTHDARVFRNSDIHDELENGILNPQFFIIGDSAYPLKPYLMTPFRDNGRLTVPKRHYNRKLSTSRQSVERAIGLLKCRFRRLTSLPCLSVERACKLITACCVLHNMCILSNDSVNDMLDDLPPYNYINNYGPLYGNAPLGVHFRNQIVQYLQTL